MDVNDILDRLRALANPDDLAGLVRGGINPEHALGVRVPKLRTLAKEIGKDHTLALALWDSGCHEARLLATMIDDYRQLTDGQMERWAAEFDSWDVVDQCVMNLFERAGEDAVVKALAWSHREEEFVKRAGFVMMARMAVGKKKWVTDETFEQFWPRIIAEAADERNFVKKAVNWALRQPGKMNLALNARAIEVAEQVLALDSPTAHWIASDALRELRSEAVLARLRERANEQKSS